MFHAALCVGLVVTALVGCRGRGAPPAPAPAPAARAEPLATPPPLRSGFVLYTGEDPAGGTTWIVPYTLGATLTAEPALRIDGWWLQDDAPVRVTAWHGGGAEGVEELSEGLTTRLWDARCALGETSQREACTWPPRQVMTRFDADGRVLEQELDGHACACFDLPVADRAVLQAGRYDEVDKLHVADGEESCEWESHDTHQATVALVGGVLQSFVLYHDLECDGTREVDVDVQQINLARRAELPRANLDDAERFCRQDDPGGLAWELPEGFELEAEAEDASESTEEDDDFGSGCDLDGEVWSIRRGLLVRSQLGSYPAASCVCHEWTPARPKLCGSLADSCGRTSAFPELSDAVGEFWVASDERAALVMDPEPMIVAAGGRLRARIEGLDPGERILGVRHHPQIDPLVRVRATAEVEEPELPGLPVALRWPSSTPPPAPALAPEDRRRVDRRGGRDWGNRCFAHFKAKRLDAAEAACAQGLAIATDETIRGAIFHSLGRIAEARGDRSAARVYYRTSLALREDEATAERFIRVLRSSR